MEEAEATLEDREGLAALNEARNKDITRTQDNSAEGPNIVIYIILEGLIGLPGDLLKLIPILGAILAFPFAAGMWLWRALSSQFKKSPLQKIVTNSLVQIIPFSNTFFLTSCYVEQTKLGKAIMGKFSKSMKMLG